MSEYNAESEHAAMRRKAKQRDSAAADAAALAAARGEEIVALKAELEKAAKERDEARRKLKIAQDALMHEISQQKDTE